MTVSLGLFTWFSRYSENIKVSILRACTSLSVLIFLYYFYLNGSLYIGIYNSLRVFSTDSHFVMVVRDDSLNFSLVFITKEFLPKYCIGQPISLGLKQPNLLYLKVTVYKQMFCHFSGKLGYHSNWLHLSCQRSKFYKCQRFLCNPVLHIACFSCSEMETRQRFHKDENHYHKKSLSRPLF